MTGGGAPVAAPVAGVWCRFRRDRAALAGLVLAALVLVLAVTAPLLFPADPLALVGRPLRPPFTDPRFPLGTDALGRDLAAQLFHGARLTLLVALSAMALALVAGVVVGAAAGYRGGWVDDALMRLADMVQTVPNFILALTLVAVLGPSVTSTVAAVAAVSWAGVARVVRAEVLALRERPFVLAAQAMGMRGRDILRLHILPNAAAPVLVMASVVVAVAILVDSALAFLGLGDPDPVSWGAMIGGGRGVLRAAPHVAAVPGLAILATVVGVSLLGDGLAAALDPRSPRNHPR